MENLPLKKLLLIFFLFIFLIHGAALASLRIVDVDFEGLVKADELSLRKKIASTEGSAYSTTLVNRDIKELYQTGLFQDVYVKASEIAGGMKLTFHVQEKGIAVHSGFFALVYASGASWNFLVLYTLS